MFKADKHLREYTIEELEQTICEFCNNPEMTMDTSMCPNCSKDNEIICIECCGCYDEENDVDWLMSNS